MNLNENTPGKQLKAALKCLAANPPKNKPKVLMLIYETGYTLKADRYTRNGSSLNELNSLFAILPI